MTLLNDFPMCLGLDELYRQMRMCQDTLRCCTTTRDSNCRCAEEEGEEGGNMFLTELCVFEQGLVTALFKIVDYRIKVILTISISVSMIDSLKNEIPNENKALQHDMTRSDQSSEQSCVFADFLSVS